MKIAFLTSEAIPYAKTGGLADVAGALPRYLASAEGGTGGRANGAAAVVNGGAGGGADGAAAVVNGGAGGGADGAAAVVNGGAGGGADGAAAVVNGGAEVRLIMPFYRDVRKKNLPLRRVLEGRPLDWPSGPRAFGVWEHQAGPVTVDFIEGDAIFDRDFLYGTPAGDYPDNGERFAFFARAALEALKAMDAVPDILHGHDWQSASAFAFLRGRYASDPAFRGLRTVFTIHNLAYQGLFAPEILPAVGLPWSLFTMNDLEFYGKVSYLKGGILYSDAVTTVSPRYAQEIQTPEFGCGLDGLLRARSSALSGILNGVDYADWNPETDKLIPATYGPGRLAGKAACKSALLDIFGLQGDATAPVVGMVTRLAGQKGLDIVCAALEGLFALGLRLVILGTGDAAIQDFLTKARARHPNQLGLMIAFDERIAHTIYAGSDLFLIPSRYEPCGLTQMYSLKYGTVPVVRATGGLEDTIREFDPARGEGNGFKFKETTPDALTDCVRRALTAFGDPARRSALIRNAMASDFSWNRSAGEYLALYRRLLGR